MKAAAAMQALRVASFMNRPTLLGLETLIMIGPYLTNSGKFLDAWALFGVTIRLAQSIGCKLSGFICGTLNEDDGANSSNDASA